MTAFFFKKIGEKATKNAGGQRFRLRAKRCGGTLARTDVGGTLARTQTAESRTAAIGRIGHIGRIGRVWLVPAY